MYAQVFAAVLTNETVPFCATAGADPTIVTPEPAIKETVPVLARNPDNE